MLKFTLCKVRNTDASLSSLNYDMLLQKLENKLNSLNMLAINDTNISPVYDQNTLGHTGTGIANSMGASSLGILLCLGVPWAITTAINYSQGKEPVSMIHGNGIQLTIFALALVSLTQFSILSISKFKLLKMTGVALGLSYLAFISYAVFAELGYIFPSLPDC